MRIHYLQHVPFENLANIAIWAGERGHAISGTRLFTNDPLPAVDSFDLLVILGGPMNVESYEEYPWLLEEKRFIGQAINRRKTVLGICLGAQLVARVLGAKVVRNPHKEIGWFPVSLTDEGRKSRFLSGLPNEFVAFHWHGDTFDIPAGASRLAESQACRNQAFEYDSHVLAIQFHLEYSASSITKMIANCGEALVAGPHIQSREELIASASHLQKTQTWLVNILDTLAASVLEG